MTHPNFICIGAQKAGTDWVYDQFQSHRDYWMPPIKEIAFFDQAYGPRRTTKAERQLGWKTIKHGRNEADYTHDISFLLRMLHGNPRPQDFDFSAYFSLFDGMPKQSGDCTPGYCRIQEPLAAEMMRQMPDTTFLLMVRDPAERLWSQALMHERLDRNPGMAVVDDFDDFKDFCHHHSVVDLSFLSNCIKTWRKVDVTGGRFKVFQFDNIKTDAEAYRRSVAEHIGADPEGFSIAANFNKKAKQPGKKKIPDEYRKFLAEYLRDEFSELEQLIGGHAVKWRERNDEILNS